MLRISDATHAQMWSSKAVMTCLIVFSVGCGLQLLVHRRTAGGLPTSSTFLQAKCSGLNAEHATLVRRQLARYSSGKGLSVDDVMHLKGSRNSDHPQILVLYGVAATKIAPYGNMQTYFVPLLKKITRKAFLPDFAFASNVLDEPEDDVDRQGGPWLGYCNTPFNATNLLLPAREGVSKRLRCGPTCNPFSNQDTREAKAVFLGSSTGWSSGHRQAAITAGILHSGSVYSGYTKLLDLPAVDALQPAEVLPSETKPKLSLADQVKEYKYIINADGHCAALRLRHLLASDSAVLWIDSNQKEWFYPMLTPYTHYISVTFDKGTIDPLPDIVEKIAWAEQNPQIVATIVDNANAFAMKFLSEHALTCYSLHLLNEYAGLFHYAHKLQDVARSGQFRKVHRNTYII